MICDVNAQPAAVDPLYKAVLACQADPDDGSVAVVATAAYSSPRLERVLRYLHRKTGLSPEDGRQDLVMVLLRTLQRGSIQFTEEHGFFSYLVNAGEKISLRQPVEPAEIFSSWEELLESADTGGRHLPLFSDQGEQAMATEAALDHEKLRNRMRQYRIGKTKTAGGVKIDAQSSNIATFDNSLSMQVVDPNLANQSEGQTMPNSAELTLPGHQLIAPQLKMNTIRIVEAHELGQVSPGAGKSKSPATFELPSARRGRPPGKPVKSSDKIYPTDEHKELSELWKKSKLLQDDYATAIGINSHSLKSYIYGRTLIVPAEVMSAARDHSKDNALSVSVLEKMFAGTMKSILERWEREYGITGSAAQLGTILEVDETTVLRWKNGAKPSIRALSRYEQSLRNHVKTMTSRKRKA